MSFKEQKQKLTEAAQTIKDFCSNHTCCDCPFYREKCGKFYPCEFWDNVPWHWDLPEIAKVSEGDYQYAVFDEDGNCHQYASSLEKSVEIKNILETFIHNKGKKLIVKKRLVMAWEQVNTDEVED